MLLQVVLALSTDILGLGPETASHSKPEQATWSSMGHGREYTPSLNL